MRRGLRSRLRMLAKFPASRRYPSTSRIWPRSSRRCQISTAFVGKQRFQCFSYDEQADGLLLPARTLLGRGQYAAWRGRLRPGVHGAEEVDMGSERFMDSPPSQQAPLRALYAPLEDAKT